MDTNRESKGTEISECIDKAGEKQGIVCDVSENLSKKSKIEVHEGGKFKSVVWEWFDKIKDSEGREKAKCKHCSKIYASDPRKNGTSALRAHMLTLCRFREVDSNQRMLSFTEKKEDGVVVGSLKAIKFDEERCRKALAKMVIVDELPFRFVESEGFRNYSKQLEPRFNVPSRITIAKYCTNIYAEEKKKLKKELQLERICLTTDTWTSTQRYGYMCLTGHWIDKEWRLQKRILNFINIIDHTGEGLGNEVMNCLSSWEIKKIFTITMDNASTNDVVARHITKKSIGWRNTILGHEFLHVRCSAHILNLIVKEGLSEYNDSIEKIRLSVKYVKGSSQRLELFKRCVLNAEIESKALLCLDVETRWNSTYLMLETAVKFERAFKGLEDINSYTSYFPNGPPTSLDWKNARLFIKLLKLFYTVTLEISGSKYPTSHLFFQNISMMEHAINSMCVSTDSAMSSVAYRMKTKFDKYWGSSEKSNVLLYVAFVLDPQCKIKRLTKCLNAIYTAIKTVNIVQLTESTLTRLYDHYNANSNQTSSQTHVGQSSSSAQCTDVDVEFSFLEYKKKMWLDDSDEDEPKSCTSELALYLKEDALKMQPNFDILNWWKVNSSRFPILSQIAKDVLAIPISTVASESAFSTGGRILDPFRSSLAPKTVEALVCCRDWLCCKPSFNEIEEIMIDTEKYEELDKDLEKEIQEHSDHHEEIHEGKVVKSEAKFEATKSSGSTSRELNHPEKAGGYEMSPHQVKLQDILQIKSTTCTDQMVLTSGSSSKAFSIMQNLSDGNLDKSALAQGVPSHFASVADDTHGNNPNPIGPVLSDTFKINLWSGSPPKWVDKFEVSNSLILNLTAQLYAKYGVDKLLSPILQLLISLYPLIVGSSSEEPLEVRFDLCELLLQYIELKIDSDVEELYLCYLLLERLASMSTVFSEVRDIVLPSLQASVSENYGGTFQLTGSGD